MDAFFLCCFILLQYKTGSSKLLMAGVSDDYE
jgi:hypothetical protein